MRAYLLPPAARLGFGPSRGLRWALLALSAGAFAITAAWLHAGLGNTNQTGKAAVALLLWLACSASAWHWWRTLPRGVLLWDGAAWHAELGDAGQPAPLAESPQVRLDLQSCMLLRTRSAQSAALWLWLAPAASPADAAAWSAIRRALYCRALAAPAPDDGAGSAAPHS